MIFYLGHKVEIEIDPFIKTSYNKTKKWRYGYNELLDVVIISKDGTLGDVYEINGVKIGFPLLPSNKKDIINSGKLEKDQKWKREEMPEGLDEETQHLPKYEDYIVEQFRRREEGVWIYLKGIPVYIPGTYWFGLQWFREEEEYPKFRIIQNELMIYWEACKADERSYGMQYVKNRRFGASMLGIVELLESGTITENKILGMISKKGNDAKKIFNRLVRGFKRLPCFFLPLWDGTTTPKTELILSEPTKKRKAGEKISKSEGLDTSISWHNTEINAMDGEKIFRSLVDEAGKYPKDVPFSAYWYIVKTSHRIGSNIVGKSMVVSTVNAKNNGGSEYEEIWKASNPLERNKNGQTKSGLYRIFIAAKYCLEGFFDEYGFSIVDNPKEPVINDLGKKVTEGAVEFLKNELELLKDDPEKYNEFLRQFPETERDAFRDEAGDCAFNLMKLMEQIDYVEKDLDDGIDGNDQVERGNFSWVNGIQDSTVKWNPDPINGRFWIAKNAHPPIEYRNLKEKKMINGVLAWSPINAHIGTFGVDPYNRSKTADGKGSFGSIHLCTKFNTGPFPNDTFILEYIDRPPKVEMFFEDVLMAMVYFSMPMLCELSNERFLAMIKDRGYRHYSLNNPFKTYKELGPTEKEFGGTPAQDSKIGDQQFYALQTYIEDYIGVARDNSNRLEGEIGNMPFSRTLYQWKDVDVLNRTKFDAYISSTLALLGNQKKSIIKAESKPIKISSLFKTYDNSGNVSKSYN